MIMDIIWPQTLTHYWIGVIIWFAICFTVSVIAIQSYEGSREDALFFSAAATVVIAFGWPVEQFIMYAIALFLVVAYAIDAVAKPNDRLEVDDRWAN